MFIGAFALSTFSFASTGVEETKIVETKENEKEAVVKKNCQNFAMAAVDYWEATHDGCLTGAQATALYNIAFNECISEELEIQQG